MVGIKTKDMLLAAVSCCSRGLADAHIVGKSFWKVKYVRRYTKGVCGRSVFGSTVLSMFPWREETRVGPSFVEMYVYVDLSGAVLSGEQFLGEFTRGLTEVQDSWTSGALFWRSFARAG